MMPSANPLRTAEFLRQFVARVAKCCRCETVPRVDAVLVDFGLSHFVEFACVKCGLFESVEVPAWVIESVNVKALADLVAWPFARSVARHGAVSLAARREARDGRRLARIAARSRRAKRG